ncbi:response regulator transcription factor [uncultured Tateyamaria sp.]|uniref:response regulator transcription factor n=1 Tax=uncultured Tateyamaria sp. TaxID=455651 RepID=UPI002638A15E|nr:response regulator transcription factor [uncultured Tateyamaria sp.]
MLGSLKNDRAYLFVSGGWLAVRVLIIEDNEQIGEFLARGLASEGHLTHWEKDGEKGLSSAVAETWDVILLDILLPILDGHQVCGLLKQQKTCPPILMLSSLDSTSDVVEGLRIGADDYLTKPFSFEELIARIENLAARNSSKATEPERDPSQLVVGDLLFDTKSLLVSRAGQQIELTSLELSLLEYLMRHGGEVLSRAKILENVWGASMDPMTNIVEVYIAKLRSKIDTPGQEKLIYTVRGRGYFLGFR